MVRYRTPRPLRSAATRPESLSALTGGFIAYRFGLRVGFPVAGALRGVALCVALRVLLKEVPRR